MISYFITFIPLSLLHYPSFSSTFLPLSQTFSNTKYKVQQQQGVWWPCWWRSFGKSSGDAASDLHDRGCKCTLICMLMYVQQQIYVISVPRSSDCLKKEEEKKLQRKAWCKCVKMCLKDYTQSNHTNLKTGLFSSCLKLWRARHTSLSCRDENRPLDTHKYHCVA